MPPLESPYWIGWAAPSWGVSWGYDGGGEPVPVDEGKLVPAGHWKHLFKPVQDVSVDAKKVRGTSRLAFFKPATTSGVAHVVIVTTRAGGKSSLKSFDLAASTKPQFVKVSATSKVGKFKASTGTKVNFLGTGGRSKCALTVSGSTSVVAFSTGGRGYVDRFVVEAIQNPTEEMLTILFS